MIVTGILISIAVLLQAVENFALGKARSRFFVLLQFAGALLALSSELKLAGVAMMFAGTWGVAILWRGTLNGGSDFMTFHILAAWLMSLIQPSLSQYCLTYIAIQLILSYFIAGTVKVARPEWRSGEAFASFLQKYGLRFGRSRTLSWALILFELSWPLAWYLPWPYIALGAIFHLANAYVFGLNRFFWAWLAAYPALLRVVG